MDFGRVEQTKQALIKFFLLQIPILWLIGIPYLLPPAAQTIYSKAHVDFVIYEYIISIIEYLSHLAILAIIPLVLFYPISKFIKKNIFWYCILISTSFMSVTLFLIDAALFNMAHIHFTTNFLALYNSETLQIILAASSHEIILASILFCGIIILEFALCRIAFNNHHYSSTPTTLVFSIIIMECFAIANLSYALNSHVYWINQRIFRLPFYQTVSQLLVPKVLLEQQIQYREAFFDQPKWHNTRLHYPLHPLKCTKPDNPPNIVFIMADSLRYDAVNPLVMPHVAKYGRSNYVFNNHISGGNSTQSGLFSLFYSITPNYWSRAYEHHQGPVFFHLLKENNYKLTSVWSSPFSKPPFDKTIYLDFNKKNLIRPEFATVFKRDHAVTSEVINLLKEQAESRQPLFVHAFYFSSHAYCFKQPYEQPFKPFVENCLRFGFRHEQEQEIYKNRYLNAVHFLDSEINKILKFLEATPELKNTIVIISSDHGEEFDDNHQGYWGHLGNFTRAATQVPLIIHWPNNHAKNYYMQTTSYDIVPTILKNIFACKNPSSDYSLGEDLFNKNRKAKPFIISGSYSSLGIIEPSQITTLYPTGVLEMTDTHAAPITNKHLDLQILTQALNLMQQF